MKTLGMYLGFIMTAAQKFVSLCLFIRMSKLRQTVTLFWSSASQIGQNRAWSSQFCGMALLILFWGHCEFHYMVRLKIVNCAIKQSGKSPSQSVVKRI